MRSDLSTEGFIIAVSEPVVKENSHKISVRVFTSTADGVILRFLQEFVVSRYKRVHWDLDKV